MTTDNSSYDKSLSFFATVCFVGIFVVFAQSKGLEDTSRVASTSIKHTTSTTQSKHEHSMCLKENEVKTSIDKKDQIFIVMPPKAGGTSMNGFARRCLGNTALFQQQLSLTNLREKSLTQSYDSPNLLVGHIFNGESMESLLKGVSKDTLIVYIHREETSRLASAIKQVMGVQCEGKNLACLAAAGNLEFVQRNETDHTCTIEENDLVKKVIQPKPFEIGASVHDIWSCNTFHTLNENRPNLVTMNMNQIDTLQKMLAEKFCPQIANEPVHSNMATQKEINNFVQLSSNSSKIVSLDEWLLKKKNMIEYTLGFKQNIGCQKNVRDMEDELFETCSDHGFMKFSYSPME